jgi:PAS domain S-box-containing protein
VEVAESAVLAAAIDALADGLAVIDADGTILWRRRSSSMRLLAVPDDETVGESAFDRIHPDDLARVTAVFEQLRAGDVPDAELSFRSFDAADPSVIHDQDAIVIDARHVPGVGGILALAMLRDTRRAFTDHVHGDDFSLAEHAPVGLAIVSPSSRIVFANHVFREQLGLELRQALTATAIAGLHELIAEARVAGEAIETLVHRDLTLRAMARRFGPSDNVVLSTSDISTEAAAVAARVRSEKTWQATFEHGPAGIALVGTDGVLLEVNPTFAAITGHDAADLVGRHFEEFTEPDGDGTGVDDVLRGERPTYRMEKRYSHPDGRTIWVDLWVAMVRDEDGEPLHFVCQILDITDTKA